MKKVHHHKTQQSNTSIEQNKIFSVPNSEESRQSSIQLTSIFDNDSQMQNQGFVFDKIKQAPQKCKKTRRQQQYSVQVNQYNQLLCKSREPCIFRCANCGHEGYSAVNIEPGDDTYIACCLYTMVGLCCLPFLLKRCQDSVHYCCICGEKAGLCEFNLCKLTKKASSLNN